jgi:hypothetical protein
MPYICEKCAEYYQIETKWLACVAVCEICLQWACLVWTTVLYRYFGSPNYPLGRSGDVDCKTQAEQLTYYGA